MALDLVSLRRFAASRSNPDEEISIPASLLLILLDSVDELEADKDATVAAHVQRDEAAAENAQLRAAAEAGLALSTWAASISWCYREGCWACNTGPWLDNLRKRIEATQAAAERAGLTLPAGTMVSAR